MNMKTKLRWCLILWAGASMANPSHDKIKVLSEDQRAALFSKMLVSEDAACNVVKTTFFRGQDKQGAAYWSVQCSKNKAYQIQIEPNATGSTKLVDCAVLKMLGSDCFRKFQ